MTRGIMVGRMVKLVLIFSVTITTPAGGQLLQQETDFPLLETQFPKVISLLENVSYTSANVSSILPHMADAFSQVVSLLEMQRQQLQDMTSTMNTVVSVLVNQQETLENISHSLPVLVDQQVSQNKRVQRLHGGIDCADLASRGYYLSGSYTISPYNESFNVYCDMDTDHGGWTVFQRRFDNSTSFYRGWDDYETGFGSADGEYWLGLSRIHQMTRSGIWTLRIDLEDFDGDTAYAEYESFKMGDAVSNYTLSIGVYRPNGTAGDALGYHNNSPFTTYDRDNDPGDSNVCDGNCAQKFRGAWWYKESMLSNLNGLYLGPSGGGITSMGWLYFRSSLKTSTMKMKRVN